MGKQPVFVIIKDVDGGSYPHWNIWHQGYQPDQTYLNYNFIGLESNAAANNEGWYIGDTVFTTDFFYPHVYQYMETGKTYINDKEVSADEYNVFANMSMKEKVQKYGQTEGLSTSVNTSDTITPQTDKISSDNLKYNSNVNEVKQVIVMTKTKEKIKYVTKPVPV